MYEKLSPLDKLATARLAARKKYPYFTGALLGLIPKEMPGLGTLAVTEKMLLLWDPAAVARWPQKKLVGVLVHEVGHVLRKHAARARALGLIDEAGKVLDPELAKLWNVAGDYEINDDLAAEHPDLFVGEDAGILPQKDGYEVGLSAEAYFAELRKPKPPEEEPEAGEGKEGEKGEEEGGEGGGAGGKEGEEEGEGEGAGGEGAGAGEPKGNPVRGHCGGCAGHRVEGEPEGGTEGRSEGEVERVRKQVAAAIKEAASKGQGNVPGGWARWADETLEPPKVRWEDKLGRFVRNAMNYRAGAMDTTHKKLSRRQWGLGLGAGKPLLAALHKPTPNVAVVVDTSGSMGAEEVTIAVRESKGILDSVGARVTVVACDARVHELKVVKSWTEIPALLKGGGGTDFRPAFDALAKASPRPGVIVFVTDGYGTAPPAPPAGCKVIWLLAGASTQTPAPWGEVIEVKP